jgi:tripartite-type tricarboxylate transporter receptor subunit TctC
VDSTGAKLLHVPYKGAAPAITDLMGGQVDGFFGDVPGLIGHVRGGKLKALGVASSKRHPSLPDVKTLEEQGIKGVDTNNWYALFAPAKTPPATLESLNKAVRNALSNPALRDKLLKTGAEPAPSTQQELAALLKRDTDKWAKLIRAKNIKAE